MEVIGKIYRITPIEYGTTKNGKQWCKRTLVIQTMEDYPKDVAMTLFGDEKCKSVENLQIGLPIIARLSISSREYDGRWFSEINCLNIRIFHEVGGNNNSMQQPMQQQPPQPQKFPYQSPPQASQVQQLANNFGAEVKPEEDD